MESGRDYALILTELKRSRLPRSGGRFVLLVKAVSEQVPYRRGSCISSKVAIPDTAYQLENRICDAATRRTILKLR